MSLRLIARDLYRLQREVGRLEKELSACRPSNREALSKALTRTMAERDALRRILDGRLDR